MRHDAESHQLTGSRLWYGLLHGLNKIGLILNDMIGGQHQQQRIITLCGGMQGRQCNGWCRIAPGRFENNAAMRKMTLT